ncbi:MAG: hypothetical protein M3O46_14765 [Myxococcota bacterium]|nr:hypothetical protein [Myxococcota bacterium]
MASDPTKETDDVSGAASAASDDAAPVEDEVEPGPGPDAMADPPIAVAELAAACVRFVSTSYRVVLDFSADTLSLLDQWVRDAHDEAHARPAALELVQSAAGAYLGEVIRREFGGRWFADGELSSWRLYLPTVYCAFNPIGMVREALLLEPAEGWHGHFELDPGERDAVDARLAVLPSASDEEYYAPSTRFDVLSIIVDALRTEMRSHGLDDVRFTPQDYESSGRP